MFPEIRRYLEEVWEQAESGTEWVITRYRSGNANLRTQLERIIRRAGLEPWAKPFQNLRSTRETELAQSYTPHVDCSWIGNTGGVAIKHYLQVTDTDFEKAAASAQQEVENARPCGPNMDQLASPRAGKQQYIAETTTMRGGEESDVSTSGDNPLRLDAVPYATPFAGNDLWQAPRQGLEPWTKRLTAACSTN